MTERSREDAPKQMPGQHDKTYRLLFSYPEMVEDTLKGFIHESWVFELDYSTLERMAESHVSERFDLRFQDVVWKVRYRDKDVYLCLLIEFQSTVDRYMVFRIALYVMLFYDDLIRQLRDKDQPDPDPDLVVDQEDERHRKLALAIPIVCYNGKPIWWPSVELAEMLQVPPGLEHLAPRFSFLLIDEHRIPDERLEVENLLAGLIGLEKTESLEALLADFRRILEWVRRPGIRRAFASSVKVMLARLGVAGEGIEKLEDPEEVETVLAENLMEWRDRVREEGREEGQLAGEALILTRQLQLKFGSLDEATRERIGVADSERLLRWADRVLTADSLSAVFDID